MHLHVIAGCRELMLPNQLDPELAASLVGTGVRAAETPWISPKSGRPYHASLQENPDDRRTEVMAVALNDGFGARYAPLLILPDLLDEVDDGGEGPDQDAGLRSQRSVLAEILQHGRFQKLTLHALALSATIDAEPSSTGSTRLSAGAVRDRIDSLGAEYAEDLGETSVETITIELSPEQSVFATAYANSIANAIAGILAPKFAQLGLESSSADLAKAVSGKLAEWKKRGLHLAKSPGEQKLSALSERLFDALL